MYLAVFISAPLHPGNNFVKFGTLLTVRMITSPFMYFCLFHLINYTLVLLSSAANVLLAH